MIGLEPDCGSKALPIAKTVMEGVDMIYHSIRISIKPDTPKDQVEAALELLRRMGREIEAVESSIEIRSTGTIFGSE